MQEIKDKHTISSKLNDSSMYAILFIGALIFINIVIIAFMLPLTLGFSEHFPDVAAYLQYGYADSKVIYSNLMSIASCIPQLVAYVFFICMFLAIGYNIVKKDLFDFKKKWLKNIFIIVIASVIMYFANQIVSIIYVLLGIEETSSNQLAIYGMLNSSCCIPAIILIVVAAPIVEEIVYRKLMFGFFGQTLRLNKVLVVIISAVVFALIHCVSGLDQLVYFPMYFAMALPLVIAYEVSNRNIFVTIAIHMINNIISVLLWALLM